MARPYEETLTYRERASMRSMTRSISSSKAIFGWNDDDAAHVAVDGADREQHEDRHSGAQSGQHVEASRCVPAMRRAAAGVHSRTTGRCRAATIIAALTNTDYEYFTDRYKLGLTYDFGDSSWSGETWISTQLFRERNQRPRAAPESHAGGTERARAVRTAIEFWNPFGSFRSALSGLYTPARANSQEVDRLDLGR